MFLSNQMKKSRSIAVIFVFFILFAVDIMLFVHVKTFVYPIHVLHNVFILIWMTAQFFFFVCFYSFIQFICWIEVFTIFTLYGKNPANFQFLFIPSIFSIFIYWNGRKGKRTYTHTFFMRTGISNIHTYFHISYFDHEWANTSFDGSFSSFHER